MEEDFGKVMEYYEKVVDFYLGENVESISN